VVKLGFDIRGHAFKAGLDVLREGYASASRALTADVERVRGEAAAYEASPEFIGEHDDEGHIIWEQGTVLAMQRQAAEESLKALRKAYVLILYHHWERAIRAYTDSGKSADHEKLVKRATAKGVPINARLDIVRDLANALKHGKGGSLQQSWPEVLTLRARSHEPRDWYEAVQLEDAHVAEAFEIIAQSGPQIWPNGKPSPLSLSEL
jgi:hypothetical protein